jgi:predicted RNA-binding Zn-ribbon protein involved in translation (DUF1610 family)
MEKKKGGFKKIKDYSPEDKCMSTEHNPPAHIVLQPGEYEYTCPSCGKTVKINIPLIL